jgi:alkanesulfonate monooxygenase SsuD/methylene tetrahydromethanopterin reductase-like flavin-dependent oxidoreductase (luciferase family)
MEARPFRFGVQLHAAQSASEWGRTARRAEALGYDVVCIPDHVGPQLAPFPALAAAAAATDRIRAGTLVLDNDFRHPLLTAHEAVTLQILSAGRFELGLGAGWLRRDYDRLGVELAPPRVRVERLEEAVEIIVRYFRGEPFSFSGRHYAVADADPLRLPAELSPPALLVGGGGPRVLALAARHAGVASVLNVLLQAFEVTGDRAGAVERRANDLEMTAEDFGALPFGLVGTIDEIVDDLERHRSAYGVSYFTVRGDDLEAFGPVVERLAGR